MGNNGKFVRLLRSGAVVLLLLMLAIFQTGCTVQKRQFGRGFHVEFRGNGIGRFGPKNGEKKQVLTYQAAVMKSPKNGIVLLGKTTNAALGVKNFKGLVSSQNSHEVADSNRLPADSAIKVIAQRNLESSILELPAQSLPMNVLLQGSGSSKLLDRGNEKGILDKRVFTLHRNGKSICGRMVGVNPNGVFIQNHHKELMTFGSTPYGKFQDSIYRRVYFVPFKELNAIHLGGSLFYKVEKMLERIFEWIAILMLFVLTVITVILAKGTDIFRDGGWEIIAAILAFVAVVVGVIVALAMSVVLLIVLFPFQWIASHFPGRYWRIKKDSENGKLFIRDLLRRDWRYRVF